MTMNENSGKENVANCFPKIVSCMRNQHALSDLIKAVNLPISYWSFWLTDSSPNNTTVTFVNVCNLKYLLILLNYKFMIHMCN